MELLYVWIGKYYNLEDKEFNFSKDYQFHYDAINQKLSVKRIEDRITPLLKDRKIKNVTGIIGANGSGKTNLLEFISTWFMNLTIPQIIVCDFGIGYSEDLNDFEYLGNNIYAVELTKLTGSFSKRDKFRDAIHPEHSSQNMRSIIYYSPQYDMRHIWRHSNYCIDISTNFLLTDPQLNNSRPNSSAVQDYKLSELRKHSAFINSELYTELPFQYPNQFKMYTSPIQPYGSEFYGKIRRTKFGELYNKLIIQIREYYQIAIRADYRIENLLITKNVIAFLSVYNYLYDLHYSIQNKVKESEIIDLCNLFSLGEGYSIIEELQYGINNTQFSQYDNETVRKGIYYFINFVIEKLTIENIHLFPLHAGSEHVDPFMYFKTYINNFEINSWIVGDFIEAYDKTILKNNFLEFYPAEQISSGQGSFITLFSRLYAIRDKVEPNSTLLIMIDEGESGFHPQWQKRYVKYIIDFLPRIFPNNDLQLIIASHSPFIASDIPKSNTRYLLNKTDPYEEQNETFAANIYDLYKSSFILNDGFIGDFAMENIQDVIDILLDDKAGVNIEEIKRVKSIIEITGEPILRKKLIDLWNFNFGNINGMSNLKDDKDSIK